MAKAQAENMRVEAKGKLAELQTQLDIRKLESEAQTKRELMQYEFDLNMKLKEMELDAKKQIELQKPPSTAEPKKGFESAGNDVLGGIDLSRFEPR